HAELYALGSTAMRPRRRDGAGRRAGSAPGAIQESARDVSPPVATARVAIATGGCQGTVGLSIDMTVPSGPMPPEAFDAIVERLATALVEDVRRKPSGSSFRSSAIASAEPQVARRIGWRPPPISVSIASGDDTDRSTVPTTAGTSALRRRSRPASARGGPSRP